MESVMPTKKKRGRKPKNNITINENPVFNNTLNTSLVIKLDNVVNNEKTDEDKLLGCNIQNEYKKILSGDGFMETKKTSEVCWNCCHGFHKNIIGLPIKVANNLFYTIGDFCSLECASRYALDNYENNYHEILSIINLYNYQINNKSICMAKNKLELVKFGGNLTIEEYRKNFQLNDNLIEPRIKHIVINNNRSLIKNNNLNNLKLYRKKLINENDNSISNIMKLEIS